MIFIKYQAMGIAFAPAPDLISQPFYPVLALDLFLLICASWVCHRLWGLRFPILSVSHKMFHFRNSESATHVYPFKDNQTGSNQLQKVQPHDYPSIPDEVQESHCLDARDTLCSRLTVRMN